MSKIYDQHRAAFARVSAYVVLKDGERVATIAFKHPRDGAGRLYAYVHWIGTEMVRGYASGGGYDKRSAACYSAAFRMDGSHDGREISNGASAELDTFIQALVKDDGWSWEHNLREAGFTVFQAV